MINPELIARVAPLLRGLLAEPTGNDDQPFRAPILRSFANEQDLASKVGGAPGGKELRLKTIDNSETDDALRNRIKDALIDYQSNYKSRPHVIFAPDCGVFQAINPAPTATRDGALAGKVALVTGAAGAIGFGICRALLAQGCHLAVSDLPGDRLEDFAAEFKTYGEKVVSVGMDVTDRDSVAKAFAALNSMWGGVDLVIMNAGVALACSLVEMELEAFRRLEKVNVEGTLLTLAEAGRTFARQNIGGDIILISTKNVFAPGAGFGAYSATKAGAHQLARIASLEFAPMKVRVNMVAPDAVFSGGKYKSGLWAEVGPGRMKARGLDEQGLEEYYRNRNLLKAKVTAEHVANAVLFFAERRTPTTGACIPVDGGLPDATPR